MTINEYNPIYLIRLKINTNFLYRFYVSVF